MNLHLKVVQAYLKQAALKHWMGALELAQALSGKPDIGQAYQALQEQKQRMKHEQLQTHKKPGEIKAPPPRNQKPEESQEYDIEEEEKETN